MQQPDIEEFREWVGTFTIRDTQYVTVHPNFPDRDVPLVAASIVMKEMPSTEIRVRKLEAEKEEQSW